MAGISSRWVRWEMRSASATKTIFFIKQPASIVGAVGLISIHLAFYQMNPWPTALAAFSIFGTYMNSTPVGIFCFLHARNPRTTPLCACKITHKISKWLLTLSALF